MLGKAALALLASLTLVPLAAAQEMPKSDKGFSDALQQMFRQTGERIDAANRTPELSGSGPWPAQMEVDLALPDATLYRPKDLAALGRRKLGVLIWGNGGCTNDGASARAHLAEIASHGYLVLAPGKPLTGPLTLAGAPKPKEMTTQLADLRALLYWALAENGRPGSPYYRRIDPRAVAAAGHSCGGMQAIMLGDDPRVRTVLIHNSGIFPNLPDNPPLSMHRERLRGLHGPVLFVLGGKSDVAWGFAESSYDAIDRVQVFFGSLDVGHGGTFQQPHGGPVAKMSTDWLEWQLFGDRKAARTFTGADCGLCTDAKWTVRKKRMP